MAIRTILSVFAVLALASAALAEETKDAPKELKPQATCPVMGGAINKEVFVDFQGQRIYFCCGGCPAAFRKDPEKHFAKFAKDGVLLESIQATDPVNDKPIVKAIFTDYKGRRIYFSVKESVDAFAKSPEEYLKKLEPKAEAPAPEKKTGDGQGGNEPKKTEAPPKTGGGHGGKHGCCP